MITGMDNSTVTAVIDVDLWPSAPVWAEPFNFMSANSGSLQLEGVGSLNTAVITESSGKAEASQITQYWS